MNLSRSRLPSSRNISRLKDLKEKGYELHLKRGSMPLKQVLFAKIFTVNFFNYLLLFAWLFKIENHKDMILEHILFELHLELCLVIS